MKLPQLSKRTLTELALEFDDAMSDININVWKMNQSRYVEHIAFLFVIDPSMIDVVFTDSNTPSDYDRDWIVRTADRLRLLWKRHGLWLYNDHLITASEWKNTYNSVAIQNKGWMLLL